MVAEGHASQLLGGGEIKEKKLVNTHVLSRERCVSCRVVLGELQVGVELGRPCEISAVFQPDKGGGNAGDDLAVVEKGLRGFLIV